MVFIRYSTGEGLNWTLTLEFTNLKKILCSIYFETIYFHCLIWRKFIVEYILRKYIVWFEENFLSDIFWENILFDLKRIYCRIYFEKIYCLIWRKFIVEYILKKYTVSFEENLSLNIFWEDILFDLRKIKKAWWVKHKR